MSRLLTKWLERRLRAGARMLRIDLERLPAKKSASPKVRLAALLKLSSAVSNRWLAGRLAMGRPASGSQFVRRFQLAGGADERAFRKAMSRVKGLLPKGPKADR